MDIIILTAFFGVFFIIGLFAYKKGLKGKRNFKSCETWEKVVATIVSKEFKQETDTDSNIMYHVDILFRYTYQSIVYENNKICFGYSPSNIYSFHFPIYDKVKNASEIEVWINPSNAGESIIVKEMAQSNNLISNFGLAFMVLAVCMYIMFILMSIPTETVIIDEIQTLK